MSNHSATTIASGPSALTRLLDGLGSLIASAPRRSVALVLILALVAGSLAWTLARQVREADRLVQLEIDARRRALEVTSNTLNGGLMGALSLLGVIDSDIKSEAKSGKTSGYAISDRFESIGRAYLAEGVFLAGRNGIIGSAWDRIGKSPTGFDVGFRPYFQTAMRMGVESVYAGVSQARGERMLFFAAPVFSESSRSSEPVGAVVARVGMAIVDEQLRRGVDLAVLLSPQGVVFASSRPEWVGLLSGRITQERVRAIQEHRQFGDMFTKAAPRSLPIEVTSGVHGFEGERWAAISVPVRWNDPLGDWTLVVYEDLDRVTPLIERLLFGIGGFLTTLLVGMLFINVMRGRHSQQLATQRLSAHLQDQALTAQGKSRVAAAGAHMQQCQSLDQLAQVFLGQCGEVVESLQGVVYVLDQSTDSLTLAGSYACTAAPPGFLVQGEGLLGEVARSGVERIVRAGEGAAFRISSALGESMPTVSIIRPISLQGQVLGVVELAFGTEPPPLRMELLADLCDLLALNLLTLRRGGTAGGLAS